LPPKYQSAVKRHLDISQRLEHKKSMYNKELSDREKLQT